MGSPEQVGAVVSRALTTSLVGSKKEPSNEAVISDALLVFVDELFVKLNADYPLTWAAQFKGDDGAALADVAHATWAERLVGFTPKQIMRAYAKLDALPEYVKFAPGPKAFRLLCVAVKRADEEHERFLARRERRLLPRPKPSPEALAERRKKIADALGRPLSLRGSSQGGE